MKDRIEYFDEIKGFAILLVVFCHYVVIPDKAVLGNIIMIIAWAACPLFFMVSGGLMHRYGRNPCIKNDLNRVVKTYICICIWKAIYLIWFSNINDVVFSKAALVQYLFLFGELEGVNTGLFWFMDAYLLALIFRPVSNTLLSKGENKVFLFVLVLLLLKGIVLFDVNFLLSKIALRCSLNNINITAISSIIPYGNYSNMLFYFLFGAYLYKYYNEIGKIHSTKVIYVSCIIIGIFGLLIVKYSFTGSIHWDGFYLPDGYSRVFTAILTLGLYLLFAYGQNMVYIKKMLSFMGKYTMGIYYIHYLLLAYYSKIIRPVYFPYEGTLLNFIQTVIVICISVGITAFFRKIPGVKRIFI